MSIVDEAVVWGKRSVDPWNRLTCCQQPVLCVIEFCQIQGPRPLYSYPVNGGGPHLDLDSVAIWLMSSEAINGSSMIIYNQQMDIYACVHYSILLDLRARAFQRPISLALLTSTKPTVSIFKEFIKISERLLSLLLICNRTLFRSNLFRLVDLTKTLDDNNVLEDNNLFKTMSKSVVTKIRSLSEQTQRMSERFANNSLQSLLSSSDHCRGHDDPVGDDSEFIKQFEDNHPPLLQEVQFLTPCTYGEFIKWLPDAYESILKSTKLPRTGTLFCAEMPVLKLKDRDNHILDNSTSSYVNFPDENDYLRNLTTIIEALDKVLFALLSGEKLALWSVDERKSLGKDLLKKLNLLRVCMQRQNASWNGEYENIDKDSHLFGQSVPRESTVTDSTDDSLCVYDVDGRWLKCKDYKGKLLDFFSQKQSDSFPTDYALIQYITAQLTDVASILYLAKYRDIDRLRERLQIEDDDLKMLLNLLAEIDVLKYGTFKEKFSKEKKRGQMIIVKV